MTPHAAGMSTPMTRHKVLHLASAAFLIICTAPLQARSDRLLVLPFHVSGKAPAGYFQEADLPRHGMQAALFLSRLLRDYRSIPYTEGKQGFDEQAAENRLGRFCSDPNVSHVLGGHLLFTGPSDLTVEIFTASCVRRSILYRDRSSGSINEIQSLMRKSIYRTTPFLPESRSYARLQNFDQMKDNHLHVVVDLSGSMELTLPFIRSALETLVPSPQQSITITTIASPNRIDHTEAFTEPVAYRKAVRSLHGSGTTSEAQLLDGLRRAESHLKPGTDALLFLTDASFSEKGMLQLHRVFRRYHRSGIRVGFFPGYGSDPSFLNRTERFDRIAHIADPVFARKGSFVSGESHFFVRKGAYYFLCPTRAGEEIASGRLDTKQCQPFPAHRYAKGELDLDRIVPSYAKKNNRKVNAISPVYSDLAFRIADFISDRSGSRAPYRILLRNGNQAFWIGLTHKRDYLTLSQKKGQKLYVGLHLKRSASGIENIPVRIYLLPDAEVPRLFILEYERLLRLRQTAWNSRDAWFFHVEVRDYRHE